MKRLAIFIAVAMVAWWGMAAPPDPIVRNPITTATPTAMTNVVEGVVDTWRREFTVAQMGDLQNAGSSAQGITYLTDSVTWLIAQKTTLNIKGVVLPGDLVNDSTSEPQWLTVTNQLGRLVTAGIPLFASAGNHDRTGSHAAWNAHMSSLLSLNKVSSLAAADNYAAAWAQTNGGLKMLFVGLGYPTNATDFGTLTNYGQTIAAAYSDYLTIFITHAYLDTDGNPLDSGGHYEAGLNGIDWWTNVFSQEPNIVQVLCGHVWPGQYAHGVEWGAGGTRIDAVLFDQQDQADGGANFIRLYRYKPWQNVVHAHTYNSATSAYITTNGADFVFPIRSVLPPVSLDLLINGTTNFFWTAIISNYFQGQIDSIIVGGTTSNTVSGLGFYGTNQVDTMVAGQSSRYVATASGVGTNLTSRTGFYVQDPDSGKELTATIDGNGIVTFGGDSYNLWNNVQTFSEITNTGTSYLRDVVVTNTGVAGNGKVTITNGNVVLTGNGMTGGYVTATNGFRDPSNVKFYGAKGDNSADDSSAIQAAINAATNYVVVGTNYSGGDMTVTTNGEVYLPAGRYRIGSGLTLHPGVILRGDGIDKTIIQWTNVGVGVTCYYDTGVENVGFRGANYWTGVAADALPGNICLKVVSDDYHVYVRECHFNGFDTAAYLDTCWILHFENNHFTHCKNAFLVTNIVNAVKIMGGEISSCTNGVYFSGGGHIAEGISFSHGAIQSTDRPFYVAPDADPQVRNLIIEDNYFENPASMGQPLIYLTNVISGVIAKNNFVGGTGCTNIFLTACHDVQVADNDYLSAAKSLYQDALCYGCNITGNRDIYFDAGSVHGNDNVIFWASPTGPASSLYRMPKLEIPGTLNASTIVATNNITGSNVFAKATVTIDNQSTTVTTGNSLGELIFKTEDESTIPNRNAASISALAEANFVGSDSAPTSIIFSNHTTSGVSRTMTLTSDGNLVPGGGFVGKIASGSVTNAAGSRVAYLTDIGTGSSNITDSGFAAVARNITVNTNLYANSAVITNLTVKTNYFSGAATATYVPIAQADGTIQWGAQTGSGVAVAQGTNGVLTSTNGSVVTVSLGNGPTTLTNGLATSNWVATTFGKLTGTNDWTGSNYFPELSIDSLIIETGQVSFASAMVRSDSVSNLVSAVNLPYPTNSPSANQVLTASSGSTAKWADPSAGSQTNKTEVAAGSNVTVSTNTTSGVTLYTVNSTASGTGSSNITDNAWTADARNLRVLTNLFANNATVTNLTVVGDGTNYFGASQFTNKFEVGAGATVSLRTNIFTGTPTAGFVPTAQAGGTIAWAAGGSGSQTNLAILVAGAGIGIASSTNNGVTVWGITNTSEGGTVAFNALTTGENTTAAMIVGVGSTLLVKTPFTNSASTAIFGDESQLALLGGDILTLGQFSWGGDVNPLGNAVGTNLLSDVGSKINGVGITNGFVTKATSAVNATNLYNANLPVATNIPSANQVLTASSATTTKWADPTGGAQTPWTSDINAAQYSLTNVATGAFGALSVTGTVQMTTLSVGTLELTNKINGTNVTGILQGVDGVVTNTTVNSNFWIMAPTAGSEIAFQQNPNGWTAITPDSGVYAEGVWFFGNSIYVTNDVYALNGTFTNLTATNALVKTWLEVDGAQTNKAAATNWVSMGAPTMYGTAFLQSGVGVADTNWVLSQATYKNVKAYGAIGNGTADDSASIQAAFDAASTNSEEVFIPPGRYKVLTALRMPKTRADGNNYSQNTTNSVKITGAGLSSTTLFTDSTNCLFLWDCPTNNGANYGFTKISGLNLEQPILQNTAIASNCAPMLWIRNTNTVTMTDLVPMIFLTLHDMQFNGGNVQFQVTNCTLPFVTLDRINCLNYIQNGIWANRIDSLRIRDSAGLSDKTDAAKKFTAYWVKIGPYGASTLTVRPDTGLGAYLDNVEVNGPLVWADSAVSLSINGADLENGHAVPYGFIYLTNTDLTTVSMNAINFNYVGTTNDCVIFAQGSAGRNVSVTGIRMAAGFGDDGMSVANTARFVIVNNPANDTVSPGDIPSWSGPTWQNLAGSAEANGILNCEWRGQTVTNYYYLPPNHNRNVFTAVGNAQPALMVLSGQSAYGSLQIGANAGQNTATANANKHAAITAPRYASYVPSEVGLLSYDATVGANIMKFGGGLNGFQYDCTELQFVANALGGLTAEPSWWMRPDKNLYGAGTFFPTNGLALPTKTDPPGVSGYGQLWNSNSILLWVTATSTNQVSPATAQGPAFYGPFTNTTTYGDAYRTNGTYVYPGGFVSSNAVGSVTLASGGITAVNWRSPTNTPSDGQALLAAGTAGYTKWGAAPPATVATYVTGNNLALTNDVNANQININFGGAFNAPATGITNGSGVAIATAAFEDASAFDAAGTAQNATNGMAGASWNFNAVNITNLTVRTNLIVVGSSYSNWFPNLNVGTNLTVGGTGVNYFGAMVGTNGMTLTGDSYQTNKFWFDANGMTVSNAIGKARMSGGSLYVQGTGYFTNGANIATLYSSQVYLTNVAVAAGGTVALRTNVFTGTPTAGFAPIAQADGTIAWGTVSSGTYTNSKAITLTAPSAAENITMFYTKYPITVDEVEYTTYGSSPSTAVALAFSTTRTSASSNLLWNATITTTGTSTTFGDNTVDAGSWVWLVTTATSGTVNDLNVTVTYH